MIATGQTKLFELIKLDSYLSKSVIILISGKKGVGKSYIAEKLNILLRNSDYTSEIRSFANGIKKCANEFFYWDGLKNDRGRKLLQSLGNIGREYNPNVWVADLVTSIEDELFLSDVYIVDDWRFPNEKEYLESLGLYVIITVRVESKERGDYADTDISENSLPVFDLQLDGGDCPKNYYDFVIDNDENIEEKLKTILEVIEKMEVGNE